MSMEMKKFIIMKEGKHIGFGPGYDEYDWEDYIVKIFDNSIEYNWKGFGNYDR